MKQWLNTPDYNIARFFGEYFNLNNEEMDTIIKEVQSAVSNWEEIATGLGVPSAQRRLLETLFNLK